MLQLQGQTRALVKFNCVASHGPARASAESTERDQPDGVRNARDIDRPGRHHRPRGVVYAADCWLHIYTPMGAVFAHSHPFQCRQHHVTCECAALSIFLL